MKRFIFQLLLLLLALSWVFLFSADSAVATGADIYKDNCQICHGEKGDGNGPMAKGLTTRPEDFTDKTHMAKESDKELFETINNGKGIMPKFGGILGVEEIKEVLKYIRQFAK